MDVTVLDRSAATGHSALHRAAPVAKLIAAALMIAAVIVTADPFVIAGIAFALVAAALVLRLPLRPILLLSLYPALFAAVFAFAAAPGPVTAATIVLKAVTAALVVVIVMFTTPYPQVFAPIQRVVPVIVGDSLLMTYRSMFILADKFADLLRAARLRSGFGVRQPYRSARTTVRALGGLMLYSLDLSQREYDILRVRGYEGRLRVTPQRSGSAAADAAALAFAATGLAVAVAFRTLPTLAGFSWLLAAGALVALLAGALLKRRTR